MVGWPSWLVAAGCGSEFDFYIRRGMVWLYVQCLCTYPWRTVIWISREPLIHRLWNGLQGQDLSKILALSPLEHYLALLRSFSLIITWRWEYFPERLLCKLNEVKHHDTEQGLVTLFSCLAIPVVPQFTLIYQVWHVIPRNSCTLTRQSLGSISRNIPELWDFLGCLQCQQLHKSPNKWR